MGDHRRAEPLILRIGHDELVVGHRYEVASILNDALIALWFVAGSVMFFYVAWVDTGTWCFLLGSIQLLIRPAIRLARHFHLRRTRGGAAPARGMADAPQDY
jgi:hypothetical protein